MFPWRTYPPTSACPWVGIEASDTTAPVSEGGKEGMPCPNYRILGT